jgi:hypothetical protein
MVSIRLSLFLLMILVWLNGTVQAARFTEGGKVIPLQEADRFMIEKYLGKGVVGRAIPAPEFIDAARYLAPDTGTWNYRHVSGPETGKIERHQSILLEQEPGKAIWRYDMGERFIHFVTAQPDGDYVLTAVTDTEEGVINQYSPAEPFMLQGISPGEEHSMTLNVKVFDLNNPGKQMYTGSMDINYHYIGAYKVKVPAGSFDAVLVKWTSQGKIGPASIDNTRYRFFVPDVGMVAAVERLNVSALLIYNHQRKIGRVLVTKPES